MQQLQPPAVRLHQQKSPYLSSDLDSCTLVFVRHDTLKKPLQQPYDNPFKFTKRFNRHFTLYIKGKESIVSIDHLKLAYLESTKLTFQTPDFSPSTVSSTPSPYTVTFSWRHVRLPKLLINISPDYWGGSTCGSHVGRCSRKFKKEWTLIRVTSKCLMFLSCCIDF